LKKEKAINMNIDTKAWEKVGFLAVMSDTSKKKIVETAIQLLWEKNKKEGA
jgi:hypothetical protein